jgi:hypothetical protein
MGREIEDPCPGKFLFERGDGELIPKVDALDADLLRIFGGA